MIFRIQPHRKTWASGAPVINLGGSGGSRLRTAELISLKGRAPEAFRCEEFGGVRPQMSRGSVARRQI